MFLRIKLIISSKQIIQFIAIPIFAVYLLFSDSYPSLAANPTIAPTSTPKPTPKPTAKPTAVPTRVPTALPTTIVPSPVPTIKVVPSLPPAAKIQTTIAAITNRILNFIKSFGRKKQVIRRKKKIVAKPFKRKSALMVIHNKKPKQPVILNSGSRN